MTTIHDTYYRDDEPALRRPTINPVCACGHPLSDHCGQEGMCATQRDLCPCYGFTPTLGQHCPCCAHRIGVGVNPCGPPDCPCDVLCVHVFLSELDVCLSCGTPNPASLR